MLKKIAGIILTTLIAFVLFYAFWFLRLPERTPVSDPSIFLSPANGKVSKILQRSGDNIDIKKSYYPIFSTQSEDIGSSGYLINITMNIHNVHYQRAPLQSTVIKQEYIPGKFLNAVKDSSSLTAHFENERNEITLQTEDGFTYKIIQIAGLLARRIESYIQPDQEVISTQVVGLIKMGSQVSLLLPENIDLKIKEGDIVHEGKTILLTIQ